MTFIIDGAITVLHVQWLGEGWRREGLEVAHSGAPPWWPEGTTRVGSVRAPGGQEVARSWAEQRVRHASVRLSILLPCDCGAY